jgi:2-phosphoglycerate kinase
MRYVIGGIPLSGKTSVANRLATKLDLPYISTDLIRAYTIEILGRENYFKNIPNEVNLTLENYLGNQTAEEIFQREVSKNNLLAKHISKFFKTDWSWEDYIIEGTGIQPDEILANKSDFDLKIVFLLFKNKDLIQERIYKRGLWAEAEEYADHYKSKEIAWVWQYNNYLKEKVELFNIEHIYIDNKTTEEIVNIIHIN